MRFKRFTGFTRFANVAAFALALAWFAVASAQEPLTAIRAGRLFDAKSGTMLTNQVVLLNVADGSSSIFTDVVGQNHNDAGGVHRASKTDVFSWCGTTAGTGGQGTVYRVELY